MPTTINGIGTHYYGQQNLNVRRGTCHSCGKLTTLSSYDTRLWFVVLYIPLIPIERKRIIDECSSCQRHYAAGVEEYAKASQDSIAEVIERFRAQPEIDTALETHGTMLGFHQHAQAEEFRQEALAEFPRDAKLRITFANHLESMGRDWETAPLYAEAYQLESKNPAARLGVAVCLMNANKLDEARELLDFLETPGAGKTYPLGALESLALLYQKAERHEEALQIFRHLLGEFPDAAQNHAVRKQILISERKLGLPDSVLPARQGSWLQLFNPWSRLYSKGQRFVAVTSLIAIVIGGGLVAWNEHVRTHRTLHLLSGLGEPVTVQIDDLPTMKVNSHERVLVSEGQHQVHVTAPFQAEYSIDMHAPFLDRFFKKPAWVVNVAGTAPLFKLNERYASKPSAPEVTTLAGTTTIAYPDIDYIFEKPPQSMTASRKGETVVKSVLMVTPVEPTTLATMIPDATAAMSFLEAHLALRKDNAHLLALYCYFAKGANAESRAEKFLRSGLDRRPLEVNWHRIYQTFQETLGHGPELLPIYDAALAKEPENGELIYLRARIEPDVDAKYELAERARLKSPNSPWPWNILVYLNLSRADWPATDSALKEGTDRKMDPDFLRSSRFLVRLATGQRKEIAAESRASLKTNPQDYSALTELLDAIADRPGQVRTEYNNWKAQRPQEATPPDYIPVLDATVCYMTGDFSELEKCLTKMKPESATSIKVNLWLATGHPERIVSDPTLLPLLEDPWLALGMSIAFHSAGNKTLATEWWDKAVAIMKRKGMDENAAANLLTAKDAPSAETIRKFALEPTHKLLVLCALSQTFSSIEKPCGELARQLNQSHAPPYHLVRRVFPENRGDGK